MKKYQVGKELKGELDKPSHEFKKKREKIWWKRNDDSLSKPWLINIEGLHKNIQNLGCLYLSAYVWVVTGIKFSTCLLAKC